MALHITVGLLAIAGALLTLGTAHTAGGLLLRLGALTGVHACDMAHARGMKPGAAGERQRRTLTVCLDPAWEAASDPIEHRSLVAADPPFPNHKEKRNMAIRTALPFLLALVLFLADATSAAAAPASRVAGFVTTIHGAAQLELTSCIHPDNDGGALFLA